MKKICPKCGVEKELSLENFYVDKRNSKGFKRWCKPCHSSPSGKKETDKAWRSRNRDTIAIKEKARREANLLIPGFKEREHERIKKWHEDNPDKAWLSACKARAKKLGIPFDEDTSDITVPDVCPILGIALYRGNGYGPKWNSPSLDKIIPELGYIKGNRQVISHRANTMKSNASFEELIKLGDWARAQLR